MTTDPTNDGVELAKWDTDVAPDQWARDREWAHPSPEFGPALAGAAARPGPRTPS